MVEDLQRTREADDGKPLIHYRNPARLSRGCRGGRDRRRDLQGDVDWRSGGPPVVTQTTGRLTIKFNKRETKGEYTLRVNDGVRVTQAHFHCAPPGVNGPVIMFVAGFHDRGWDVDGKWINDATVTNANIVDTTCGATLAAIAQAMRDGRVYANAHTVAHPGGEIRGQVEPAGDDQ
jgi:hypothetical protein